MVLESLISPFKAEKKPTHLIYIGAIYTIVALFLSTQIFKLNHPSMVFVFLTAMAAIPFMFRLLRREEKKDLRPSTEKSLLKEHSKAIKAFLFLFIGITLAVSLWYVIAPPQPTNTLFESQLSTLGVLGHNVPLAPQHATAAATSGLSRFSRIFFNNIKVLIFCIVFSLIYGSGAIFILSWNASVLGVAIGNYIRSNLANIASGLGMQNAASYLSVVSIGLFKYSIHGIPEIAAYFVGALAGGIISFSLINGNFKGKYSEKIILDTADLIFIAIGILFIAGLLEVWVTPLIFH